MTSFKLAVSQRPEDSVDADIDWQDTLSFASIHKAALTDIGWT